MQNSIHSIIRQAFYGIEDSAFKMLEFQVRLLSLHFFLLWVHHFQVDVEKLSQFSMEQHAFTFAMELLLLGCDAHLAPQHCNKKD